MQFCKRFHSSEFQFGRVDQPWRVRPSQAPSQKLIQTTRSGLSLHQTSDDTSNESKMPTIPNPLALASNQSRQQPGLCPRLSLQSKFLRVQPCPEDLSILTPECIRIRSCRLLQMNPHFIGLRLTIIASALCAKIAETLPVCLISEQGGKENPHEQAADVWYFFGLGGRRAEGGRVIRNSFQGRDRFPDHPPTFLF